MKPERLESLRKAGVDRAIFSLPPVGADEILPRLDRLAAVIG